MKFIVTILSFLLSAYTPVIYAKSNSLPPPQITFGWLQPGSDPKETSAPKSIMLQQCIKTSQTGGQANSCMSDEINKLENEIDEMIAKYESLTVPKEKAKTLEEAAKEIKSAVKASKNKITYICSVFFLDSNGINNEEKASSIDYGNYWSCQYNRIWWLHKIVADETGSF